MRTLTLAIGNTSILLGTFSGRRLERAWRWSRTPQRADRVRRDAVTSALESVRGSFDRVVFCSVVPKLTDPVVRLIRRRWKIAPLQLTATSSHGLRIGYREPNELGADRVAAALGAQKRFPQENVIVIDCGTATTVTALRADGHLLGGAILPGVGLWPEMLNTRTAQLPAVVLQRPRRALGRGTNEAITSGIFFGHAGAIRETVAHIRAEAFRNKTSRVVATGGNAPLFQREKLFDSLAPHLVIEGLAEFAQRQLAV
jgi:type III pantothenate kinase